MKSKFKAFCFGKVPAQGDFVRVQASGKGVHAFDQWIQEGMHRAQKSLGQEWPAFWKAASPLAFIFSAREHGTLLAGILWPSNDKSGRKFPFIVGLQGPLSVVDPEMRIRLPVHLEGFWQSASDLFGVVRRGLPPREISHVLGELDHSFAANDLNVQAGYKAFLEATTQRTFWTRFYGDMEDPRRKLVWMNLSRLKNQLEGDSLSRARAGLRFPLLRKKSFQGMERIFWLDLTRRIWRRTLPDHHSFWTELNSAAPASLSSFFRQPASSQLLGFWTADGVPGDLVTIDGGPLPTAADWEHGVQSSIRVLADNPELSLQEVLNQLTS